MNEIKLVIDGPCSKRGCVETGCPQFNQHMENGIKRFLEEKEREHESYDYKGLLHQDYERNKMYLKALFGYETAVSFKQLLKEHIFYVFLDKNNAHHVKFVADLENSDNTCK